ncbi:MAG: glutamine--fructose-6-phosphate transaminase (isomerizing) [Oscillospiraceae bacterium]|nr:glutamine--fructose-6-phosphate transaminase (isomerizing) [Oscillospiraceae bacterium]
MCGIIGYTGSQNAVPLIIEGLKKLEYRGYDSAGIAIFGKGSINVQKCKGRITALEQLISKTIVHYPLSIVNCSLGHTRWATHGEPSDVNSHPHVSGNNKIAIVHNGIIENYKELKEDLQAKGANFVSETDSEVIAQLAEYYHDGDILTTVTKLTSRLKGSYALGIMLCDRPDLLVAVKKDNPLIIGVSEHGNFIASDIPAVLKHTNKIYYLEDHEIALLYKDRVEFYGVDGAPIAKTLETVTWSVGDAEKGGEAHFMLKEIKEQPKILRDTINSLLSEGENKKTLDNFEITRYNKIVIVGCGSAYNAGVVAKYVFERLCRFPCIEVELASEFRYKDAVIDEKSLVILISQSGETADTIAAMREAKAKHADTFAIVNVIGSTLAKEAAYRIYTAAGPEIAVATTKAFSAQLIVLYMMAVRFSGREDLLPEIEAIPEKVAEILKQAEAIRELAQHCTRHKCIFFIGRNIDYAIALEGSLKLKEISYIHSEAYAGGELKHGTISLIEDGTLVVAIANCKTLHGKIMSNVEQVQSRGAKVILVGNCAESDIPLPDCYELFSPSLSAIALQLFSYYVALEKGLDIDKPRNLAKSVTVE